MSAPLVFSSSARLQMALRQRPVVHCTASNPIGQRDLRILRLRCAQRSRARRRASSFLRSATQQARVVEPHVLRRRICFQIVARNTRSLRRASGTAESAPETTQRAPSRGATSARPASTSRRRRSDPRSSTPAPPRGALRATCGYDCARILHQPGHRDLVGMAREHRIDLQEHLRRALRIGCKQHLQVRAHVLKRAAADQDRGERLARGHGCGLGLQPDRRRLDGERRLRAQTPRCRSRAARCADRASCARARR